MTNKPKELTNEEFDKFIKEGLVLIDFWADWCMPCLMLSPIINELNSKFAGKIKFGKVNVGIHPEIAQKFNVKSIPNLTLLKDGKVINQFVGIMTYDKLERILEKKMEQELNKKWLSNTSHKR